MSTADQIYSGASDLGKFRVSFNLFFGVIFSAILIIFGIYLLNKKSIVRQKVRALIKKLVAPCTNSYDSRNNTQRYDCIVQIHYVYNNVSYDPIDPVHITNDIVVEGEMIDIYVDPANPSDFSTSSFTEQEGGWLVIVIGVLVLLGSIFSWWLAQRYQFYAAAQGVGMGVDLMR